MYCSSCGAKNAAESNFCRQCGLNIEKLASPKISEEAFDRALPEDEKVTALLERAYRLRKSDDIDGAIRLCQEVLEIRPDSTTAHGILGQLYEHNGERDKAVAEYERVLKLNPGSIADRVKLDDLLEGPAPQRARRSGSSNVVVVDPNGAPMRGAMLFGVAICILLILSGAALALVFNNQREILAARDAREQMRPLKSDLTTGTIGLDRSGSSSNSENGGGSGSASNGSQSASTPNYMPNYGFPAASIPYSSQQPQYAPPVYVYPPGYGPRQAAAAPVNPSTASRKPTKTNVTGERAPLESDNGVRIQVDNDGPPADGIVVSVGKQGSGAAGGRDHGDRVPLPGDSITKVTPYKGPIDPNAAYAPTSEAAAMISVGLDKLNKMDYAGAINAFKKALGGAGDETAYVYRLMGQAYQDHLENKSAATMYTHGRDEYRKLITAGRQLDRAAEGIKICETGIKICSSE